MWIDHITGYAGTKQYCICNKTKTNAKKHTEKVCYRFEALYEARKLSKVYNLGKAHLPKDAINLYKQVKQYRVFRGKRKTRQAK